MNWQFRLLTARVSDEGVAPRHSYRDVKTPSPSEDDLAAEKLIGKGNARLSRVRAVTTEPNPLAQTF